MKSSSVFLLKKQKDKSLVCWRQYKAFFSWRILQGRFYKLGNLWQFWCFWLYLNNHTKTLTNTKNQENDASMVNMNLYVLLKKKVT